MDNLQTTVDYSIHPEAIDLSGKDLMSVFGKTRDEIASAIGLDTSRGSVCSMRVPREKVTSLAGEVADEVHEWPNASQGNAFNSLSLHFREGNLIALEWNFSLESFLPRKKPWYRKWI